MSQEQRIRVLLAYDDPLLYAGLAATLGDVEGVDIVPAQAAGAGPDVVVASYQRGVALLAAHAAGASPYGKPKPKVIIVSRRDSEGEVRHAMEAGARGYLSAECELRELSEAVRSVHAGLRYVGASAARCLADCVAGELLTEREIEVMRLLVEGHANKTIARQLNIAVGTVKAHLRSVFQKLDAGTRTEAAAVAARRGLLSAMPAMAPSMASAFSPSTNPARNQYVRTH